MLDHHAPHRGNVLWLAAAVLALAVRVRAKRDAQSGAERLSRPQREPSGSLVYGPSRRSLRG